MPSFVGVDDDDESYVWNHRGEDEDDYSDSTEREREANQ